MLYEGLCAVVDGAVARTPPGSAARAHRDELVFGALREDVWVLPFGVVVEHLSLTHQCGRLPGGFVPWLTPSPHARIRWLVDEAVGHHRAGRPTAAWVAVGRALHLVADLACPAHVTRTVHLRDPYEGWVEVHGASLLGRPPLEPPEGPLGAVTQALAGAAAAMAADGTSSPWGRWLAARGRRRPVTEDEVARQAEVLLPLAMATGAAVLGVFERHGTGHGLPGVGERW